MHKFRTLYLIATALFSANFAYADTTFDFSIAGGPVSSRVIANGQITFTTAFVNALSAGAANISNYGGNAAITDFSLTFTQGIKAAYNKTYTKADFRAGTNVAFSTSGAVDISQDFFTSLSSFRLYLNSGSTQILTGSSTKTNTLTATASSTGASVATTPIYIAGPAAAAPEIDGSLASQSLLLIAGLALLNRRRVNAQSFKATHVACVK